MLVIVSDLHVTDGSSGDTIREGAFELFVAELSACARAASQREDGSVKPVERVDVVLLGDIFDIIRSSTWLNEGVRPWNEPDKMAPVVDKIVDGIIRKNERSFANWRRLANRLPLDDTGSNTAKLHFHYLVGNHDWFLHLPGPAYDAIRAKVTAALTLANRDGDVFPHDIDEETESAHAVRRVLREHRVYARHGDIYDPFNFESEHGRDASSLGDCIVVQLLNRFPAEVKRQLSLSDDEKLFVDLKEIDNVRPYLMIPEWILATLRRQTDPALEKQIMTIWRTMVDEFLEHPFVRAHDRPWRSDTVDYLQVLLPTLSAAPLPFLSRASDLAQRLMPNEGDYADFALREKAIADRSAEYVVYGHTHHALQTPLAIVAAGADASAAPLEQLYVNTGTWRRIHEKCTGERSKLEFMKAHVMTYAAFYKDGERRGSKYEVWTGRLGT